MEDGWSRGGGATPRGASRPEVTEAGFHAGEAAPAPGSKSGAGGLVRMTGGVLLHAYLSRGVRMNAVGAVGFVRAVSSKLSGSV